MRFVEARVARACEVEWPPELPAQYFREDPIPANLVERSPTAGERPTHTRSNRNHSIVDTRSNPEQIRSRLNHPVIDADRHWIEYGPVFAEQVRKAAGDKAEAK